MALILAACTPVRNPATGELQYTSLSREDEQQLGRAEHPKALAQFGGAYRNAALSSYVARVGARMQGVSELTGEAFTFTVLDSDVVNAFALPGGYVYVTRGLLALTNDEAELAGVLGHEIGHVTARHTAQRYDRAQLGQVGSVAGQLAGLLLGGSWAVRRVRAPAASSAGRRHRWVRRPMSRATRASRSSRPTSSASAISPPPATTPRAMASFLATLQADDAYRGRLAGRGDARRATFSATGSAPIRARRSASRARLAAASATMPGARETGRGPLLAALDGMIYGEDPAQGVVRGRSFQHPGLRDRVRGAAGLPAAELGDGRGGRRRQGSGDGVRHGARGVRGDLRGYLQSGWVTNQQLQQLQALEVAVGPAAVGFGQVALGGQPAAAMFAAVRWPDGRVFRLLYAKRGDLARSDVAVFEQSLRSLRALSAAEAAALKPARLILVPVRAGDTVDSFARRMAGGPDPRGLFVLLNGLDRGRALTPGDQVKLIEGGRAGLAGGARIEHHLLVAGEQGRLEMPAGQGAHPLEGPGVVERIAVGAAIGECRVDVGDGAQQAGLVDLGAGEAVRVAGAVEALVVAQRDADQVARQRRRAPQHLGRDVGVALHHRPLAAVERAGLVQDRHRDGGLADIVQQAGLGQQLGVGAAHAGGQREGREVGRDPERVREGVVVMGAQAGEDVAHQPRAQHVDDAAAGRPRAVGGELAAAPHGTHGFAEQAAGRADRRALQIRQPLPALVQLAVDQPPDAAQQDAVGARHLERRVGEAVRRHHLEAHVVGSPQSQQQGRTLQAHRGEPAECRQPAQRLQLHADDRQQVTAGSQRLERGAAIAGALDGEFPRQRRADRVPALRVPVGQQDDRTCDCGRSGATCVRHGVVPGSLGGGRANLARRAERPVKLGEAMHGRMSSTCGMRRLAPMRQTGDKAATRAGTGADGMALLFYSPDEDAQAWRRALQHRLPDLDFRTWPDAGDLAEIDAALVWRVPPGLLRTLPNLKAVLSLGAGVDAMLADPTLPDLPLCRLVDPSLSRQMSEFVLAQVLKYHRALDVYAAQQRAAVWQLPAAAAARGDARGHPGSRRARAGCRPAAARSRLHGARLEPDREGDGRRRLLRRRAGAGRVPGRDATSWSACCR